MKKTIAIIGSHGLYANYGGFDQLVNNLAEKKSSEYKYIIFNPIETPIKKSPPKDVNVYRIRLSASGASGLIYDYLSIIKSIKKVDILLLLGPQGITLIPFILIFKKLKIIVNIGGVEWLRPDKNIFIKKYLKICFKLTQIYSNRIILDNNYFYKFITPNYRKKVCIIPYGGNIDMSYVNNNNKIKNKYNFINDEYYLSVSRSIKDNNLYELCETFKEVNYRKLVLISNFSNSDYGINILKKYNNYENIILIDGLYNKPELDYVRLNAHAYIHTHTLCGTAPSLVEMIVAQVPIISIDNEQNRNTLKNESIYYNSFNQLKDILINHHNQKDAWIPSINIAGLYEWDKIVRDYENLYE